MNERRSKRAVALLGIAVTAMIGTVARAQSAVDWRQDANADPTVGDTHWINSILQNSNSIYFEGMSVPQRCIFVGLTPTAGHTFVLKFNHEATKTQGGTLHHAYDFLTSLEQAVAAADAVAPGQNLLVNLPSQHCNPEIGPPTEMATACAFTHSGAFEFDVDCPDNMQTDVGYPGAAGDVTAKVAAYEAFFGNRTLTIHSNAETTSASLVLNTADFPASPGKPAGYSLAGNDLHAEYVLTWTQSANRIEIYPAGDALFGTNFIHIHFGGHLSAGDDALSAGIGYGTGIGSAQVSGGPYHVSLESLDGASLGSQDNQIKGADILLPPPPCSITCPPDQSFSCVCAATGVSVTWAAPVVTDGTFQGCFIESVPGSGTFDTLVTSPHTFFATTVIQCRAVNPAGEVCTCQWTVTVELDTTPPTITCADDATIECPATPSFTPPTVDDACDPDPTVTFADVTTPGDCPQERSVTRTWTATDACGNSASCDQTIRVVDTTPPLLEGCPTGGTLECSAPFEFTVTATDDCEGAIDAVCEMTAVDPSGAATFESLGGGLYRLTFTATGTATITCTATDSCGNEATCTNDFSATCELFNGCTPGFWKQPQHFQFWPAPYTPDMLFVDAGFDDAFPGKTLLQVVSLNGGGLNALGRHTVAALLSAASPDLNYPLTPQEVIDMFNAVFPGTNSDYEDLKNLFAGYNELNCPLGLAALLAPAATVSAQESPAPTATFSPSPR